MTDLLDKAFSEAAKLTPEQQNALAVWILQELASEERWSQSLARSTHALERLAQEALAEYRAGLTEKLDPDAL